MHNTIDACGLHCKGQCPWTPLTFSSNSFLSLLMDSQRSHHNAMHLKKIIDHKMPFFLLGSDAYGM
jgi:hypothetical protein